jgi:GNAT superfamily N-acetyltransferase
VSRFRGPEPLGASHHIEAFDCGVESLNLWLTKRAVPAAAAGSARTFVMHDDEQDRIVGYHALATASITHDEATARAAKGMPRYRIPAVLLARLAVDVSVQGRGIGGWLLRDAMLRTLSAAESVGIRVLLTDAIDDEARSFYRHHGFEPSPTDPFNLQLLIKDIRAAVDHLSG